MSTAKTTAVAIILLALMACNMLSGAYQTNFVLCPLLGGLLALHRWVAQDREIEPSPQFAPPVMNLDGPALALRSMEQPEPEGDLVMEEIGSWQPIVIRGCQHECEPVEVEYFPGQVTIVGWVCTKCWGEFR